VVITNKYCCHSELLKNQSPREVKDGAAWSFAVTWLETRIASCLQTEFLKFNLTLSMRLILTGKYFCRTYIKHLDFYRAFCFSLRAPKSFLIRICLHLHVFPITIWDVVFNFLSVWPQVHAPVKWKSSLSMICILCIYIHIYIVCVYIYIYIHTHLYWLSI
jgi:hypothetical protein